MIRITEKYIKHSCVVNSELSEVYSRWVTKEGLQSFFGYDNNIALEIGGPFEIFMYKKRPEGDKGSEGCKILSFVPDKMISIEWIAPPKFKSLRTHKHKTWITIFFEEIMENKIEVTLYHCGWPQGEEWDKLFNYYQSVWDFVLNGLQKNYTH